MNIDNFCLDSAFETQISEILSDCEDISTNIKLNKELTKNVDSKLLAEVKGYIAKFDYMYLPKAKQELINNLESMIKDESLEVNFKICKEKRALSICYPSQIDECNKKAFGYLKELWNLISIRMNIAKKGLIARIKEVYKEKLIEYVEFREKKGRYFNEYSLNALCLTLAEYESKGINVESAISQSIERDYNWVFPPTHKPYKPRYYKYPKYSKNYKVA